MRDVDAMMATERRQRFEEFLGIGDVSTGSMFSSRGVQTRRHQAKNRKHDCRDSDIYAWLQVPLTDTRVDDMQNDITKLPAYTPTSFTADTIHEIGEQAQFDAKSIIFLSAAAAVSGSIGFLAAQSMRPDIFPSEGRAAAEEQARTVTDAVPATTAGVERTTVESPGASSSSASPPAALAQGVAGAVAAPDVAPPRQLTAEEVARNRRLAELRAQRDAINERRERIASQQEGLENELMPGVSEAKGELDDVEVRLAAARAGLMLGTSIQELDAIQEARESDAKARNAISNVYGQVVPLLLKGQRIQGILEERVTAVQTRIPEMINEELQSGFVDFTAELERHMPGISGFMKMDDLSSLSMLIGGLAAPAQLSILYTDNLVRLAISAVLLLVDISVIGVGWKMKCVTWMFGYHGSVLRQWLSVDAVSLSFVCLVRLLAMRSIRATLAHMSAVNEEPSDLLQDDSTAAFRMQLERQLIAGAQAMLQYDRLVNSFSFRLLDFLPAFDFIWQLGGMGLLFDTPGEFCEAGSLIYWCRIRGMLFLVGLIPVVISLSISLAKVFTMGSESFCIGLLEGAQKADKQWFPDGPPAFSILVRAFIVRNTTSEAAMELKVMNYEKQIAQRERDRLKAEYVRAEKKSQSIDHRLASHTVCVRDTTREEEFVRQYRQMTGMGVAAEQLAQVDLYAAVDSGLATYAGLDLQAAQAAAQEGLAAVEQQGTQAAAAAGMQDLAEVAASMDMQTAQAAMQETQEAALAAASSLGGALAGLASDLRDGGSGGPGGALGSQLAGAVDVVGLPSSAQGDSAASASVQEAQMDQLESMPGQGSTDAPPLAGGDGSVQSSSTAGTSQGGSGSTS